MASLTGAPLSEADDLLQLLAHAHLIQPTQPGRYGLHDLLRAYARELAAGQDHEDEQAAALTRLFDYYLHTAANAMDVLFPARRRRLPRTETSSSTAMPMVSDTAARLWLDTERSCLVSAAGYAAEYGWPGHAIRLAQTLFRSRRSQPGPRSVAAGCRPVRRCWSTRRSRSGSRLAR